MCLDLRPEFLFLFLFPFPLLYSYISALEHVMFFTIWSQLCALVDKKHLKNPEKIPALCQIIIIRTATN